MNLPNPPPLSPAQPRLAAPGALSGVLSGAVARRWPARRGRLAGPTRQRPYNPQPGTAIPAAGRRSGALIATAALVLLAAAWPGEARAFCGFFVSGADAQLYNNASQVALLRKGNHTVLTMSNNYKGPPEDFAMVVPVPVVLKKEQVKTLSPDVFRHIDQLSAPRLVEYWEQDPCNPYAGAEFTKSKRGGGGPPGVGAAGGKGGYGVKIEAQFEVGEYQIVILSAKDSTGLDRWLRDNRYKIPAGAAAALAPYVRDQMKFFVAKVDIKKIQHDEQGLVVLSPLRFGFDAAELRLPVRLGLLNAESKQDLLVYVLHPTDRFEAANYPNVFIPTNIEVADSVRSSFPAFYAELFDETLRRANNRAVVTEYAWQTSGCDPCPTPPLSENDLYTLGDEQIFPGSDSSGGSSGGAGGKRLSSSGPAASSGGFFGGGTSWVLTRLHTRYDQQTLTDDLIFRSAKPVVGGRANWSGGLGDQGGRIEASGPNNFQGRYIIRHYWEGALSCDKPTYGIWGGPPGSSSGGAYKPAARPAGNLAGAARGKVKLGEVVQSPLPELGIKGVARKLRKGEPPNSPPG